MPKPGKWDSAYPGAITTTTAAPTPSNSEIPPGCEQKGGLHLATSVCMYTYVYRYRYMYVYIYVVHSVQF